MLELCAIHQPNFFPWLGYFDKINKSDIFVFMDNVQFPKTGGTWTNRVNIAIKDKPYWLTVPIVRSYHGTRLIRDMEIDDKFDWRGKAIKTMELNYKKCPFFKNESGYIFNLLSDKSPSLCAFNINVISSLVSHLGLKKPKFISGVSLTCNGKATDLLISMLKAAGATNYMYGGGAKGYQEDDKFAESGIRIISQNFIHPEYKQLNSKHFIPGLSIIDALFNWGKENIRRFLDLSRDNWEQQTVWP